MHSRCTVISPRTPLRLASNQQHPSKENSTRWSTRNSTGLDKTLKLKVDRSCTNHDQPNGTASVWITLMHDRMLPTTARTHLLTEPLKVENTPSSSSLQVTHKK